MTSWGAVMTHYACPLAKLLQPDSLPKLSCLKAHLLCVSLWGNCKMGHEKYPLDSVGLYLRDEVPWGVRCDRRTSTGVLLQEIYKWLFSPHIMQGWVEEAGKSSPPLLLSYRYIFIYMYVCVWPLSPILDNWCCGVYISLTSWSAKEKSRMPALKRGGTKILETIHFTKVV